MATQDDYIRTALRVPPDLHKQIHRAAFVATRTFNAEILSRLQASFDAPSVLTLPASVEQAIEAEQRERGGTREEVMTRLIQAGLAGGGTVVPLTIAPGTTVAQVQKMINAAAKLLPADASVLLEKQ